MGNGMRTRKASATTIGLVLMVFSLIFTWSCESKDKYAGKYMAVDKEAPKQEEIYLELKPNGEGLWVVGDKDVSFSWYIKGGDLRVNTKEGGVLVGKIEGSTIKITLPARGEIVFNKS